MKQTNNFNNQYLNHFLNQGGRNLVFIIALASVCPIVFGAKMPEDNLEKFVVVGTRTPVPIEESLPSISLISAKEIEARQYRNVEDVLNNLPGLTLATTGQYGSASSLFSRGSNSDHTLFLLDGRKLNGGFSGTYNLSQLGLSNIQSVEVMRGASSVLYGAEGIGGVIALTSQMESQEDGTSGNIIGEYGSFETYNLSVNSIIREGPVGFSLGLTHLETDNQQPNSQYKYTNILPRLDFEVNDRINLDIILQYFESDLGTPNNTKSFVYPALTDFTDVETWLISPGINIDISDTLKAKAFFSHSEDNLEARNAGFFGFHTDSKTITDEVDLQIDWQAMESLTITGGLAYHQKDFHQDDFLTGLTPLEDTWSSSSAFLQARWNPFEPTNLTAGIRYDDYSDFDSPVTWNVTLSQNLPEIDVTLFAKYATAYSTPQAIDLYGPFGNPLLDSEESESWEVGFKQNFDDIYFHWGLVFFHNNFENLITFTPSFTTANVGNATTEGVELFAEARINENVRLYSNYTYLTAENNDTNSRLTRRPRHQATLGILVDSHTGLSGGIEVRGHWAREDIDGGTFAPIDAEDYLVARIFGTYDINDNVQVFGRIENLFNEQYDEVDGFPALDFAGHIGFRISFQ